MIPVIAGIVGFAFFYKLAQAAFDKEYPGDTVPKPVREAKIRAHIQKFGRICLECLRTVPADAFEVDHKHPIARGGKNSWYNLRVICMECNRKKGAKYSVWDSFTGRSN